MAEKEEQNPKKTNEPDKTLKITKHTLITTAMEKCPEALGIFFEHGLHCVGCGGAGFETIEQGCQVHGMNETEIEAMVEEINGAMKEKRQNRR
ncbi:DUF1858 domain-containing protein [Candidatus Woesearchaeota archaeon]|nr:DUF1858 domain-containing protein [Candidatus Woesearchaeota archaeon]